MENNAIVIGKGMIGNGLMHSLGITKFFSRSEHNVPYEEIHNFKYIFICLPTPTRDGKQGLDKIRLYVREINDRQKGQEKSIIIIHSTILPEMCRRMMKENPGSRIAHVPEFLTEETWEKDSEWPDIVVVGAEDGETREEVAGIFRARFKGAEFFLTDTVTASTIKYAINCLYALKVIYANQIFDFCKDKQVNYETVKAAMYARAWIGKNHLDIFHKGGRGAGGKCLGKDLDAFANYSNLPLLEYAEKINKGLILSYPKTK